MPRCRYPPRRRTVPRCHCVLLAQVACMLRCSLIARRKLTLRWRRHHRHAYSLLLRGCSVHLSLMVRLWYLHAVYYLLVVARDPRRVSQQLRQYFVVLWGWRPGVYQTWCVLLI